MGTYSGVPTIYSGLHSAGVAPVTYTITSYNNPSHYTAESYGAFGPKYIAKNHGVEHVVNHAGVTGYPTHPVNTYSTLNSVVSPVTYTTGSHVVAPISYRNVVSPVTYGVAGPLRGSYFTY